MKKNLLYLFIISLLMIAAKADGQGSDKETRNLKGFKTIGFGIPGDLEIRIGPTYSVVLEGNKNDLREVITEISGEKLQIKMDRWNFNFDDKVNVYITMPVIEGVGVSGSGKATITDKIVDINQLNLSVSGSGRIYTSYVEADELKCGISGSGNINLGEGNADNGEISISGSGNYSGESFEIDHLTVSVSGSGNCTCKAGDSLKATVSGSGNVYYNGEPSVDARVSGSGHVRQAR